MKLSFVTGLIRIAGGVNRAAIFRQGCKVAVCLGLSLSRRIMASESSSRQAPIIVSALFGPEDFAWFDGMRRAYFPVERNRLSAHLTLFHHLPPSLAPELKQRLVEVTRSARPPALASAVISLGRGVAI